MNRKMRAKINNQKARASRERRPCPKEQELFVKGETHCDTCGEELQKGVVYRVEPIPDRSEMH